LRCAAQIALYKYNKIMLLILKKVSTTARRILAQLKRRQECSCASIQGNRIKLREGCRKMVKDNLLNQKYIPRFAGK